MNKNVIRETSASSMDQDMSSSRQTSQSAQDAPSWSGGSTSLGSFDFTSARPDASIPSFDPAIAAFADLSFAQPSAPSMPGGPSGGFTARDFHDTKRMKVESDTPALDSIDYWISFDDDLDKMGSFEIDYSKRPDLLNQNKPGFSSESTPGLGSGLYSTATAPFREEDFFDDSAFEQALSDDEEMFESASNTKIKSHESANQSAPDTSIDTNTDLFPRLESLDKFQPGLRPNPSNRDVPRQMKENSCAPIPEYDEQRRFLEEALNAGRIPGALIPPNGFGVGFGAGMGGCRPPQEFEKKSQSQQSQQLESQNKPTSPKNSDMSDEPEPKKQTKRASTTRPTASRKSTSGTNPKPRSADRIAHNDVERKYRTNLKDKIAELQAAVPTLQASGGDGDSEGGEGGGQQSGNKISKGTVLTKATEYIHQLEARNKAIMQEHQQLARRLQAFETLLNSTGSQADLMMPNHSMTLFDPRGFC